MKKQNPFRRLRAKSPQSEENPPRKSASDMTDAELEESLQKARRDLLEAQHEELRIREKARLVPGDAPGSSPSKRSPLPEVFSKSKRRFK